jgi:hypothetical protein
MEVKLWLVGNVEIADIRWRLIPHLISVHPVKRNVSFWIPPVIHLIARREVLTNG